MSTTISACWRAWKAEGWMVQTATVLVVALAILSVVEIALMVANGLFGDGWLYGDFIDALYSILAAAIWVAWLYWKRRAKEAEKLTGHRVGQAQGGQVTNYYVGALDAKATAAAIDREHRRAMANQSFMC